MNPVQIAILKSRFNSEICDGLLRGAQLVLEGKAEVKVFDAPGAFELPLLAQELALSGKFDGIVALGAVIQGDTAHFEHISTATAQALMQVGLATRVPVAFGVLTTYTEDQALLRSHPDSPENKGREAAHAVLLTVETLRAIR